MLQYFGTNLDSAGHYLWEIQGDTMYPSRTQFNDLPFNPEALPYKGKGKPYQNGLIEFYNFCGFSICAIEGSCRDTRPGSKSIFFVKENLTKEQIIEIINATPVARKMIDKMPFHVDFFKKINQ